MRVISVCLFYCSKVANDYVMDDNYMNFNIYINLQVDFFSSKVMFFLRYLRESKKLCTVLIITAT